MCVTDEMCNDKLKWHSIISPCWLFLGFQCLTPVLPNQASTAPSQAQTAHGKTITSAFLKWISCLWRPIKLPAALSSTACSALERITNSNLPSQAAETTCNSIHPRWPKCCLETLSTSQSCEIQQRSLSRPLITLVVLFLWPGGYQVRIRVPAGS